ncbi:MAG: hypothetical protein FWG40_06100 [Peptococcaceae bacterium]|nr:hypothetical protein [Peptococcaceae bacterium]
MKRIWMIGLVMVLVFSLAGCSRDSDATLGSAIKSFIKGDVTGELNKTYSTKWFDFNVKSIRSADEYGGKETVDGYRFVVVRVTETNTFKEPIPMFSSDFYLKAAGLSDEDMYPLDAFEDVDTMMPDEFNLEVNQTKEYDVVFAIPDDIEEVSFVYVEIDINESVGATFTIKHKF